MRPQNKVSKSIDITDKKFVNIEGKTNRYRNQGQAFFLVIQIVLNKIACSFFIMNHKAITLYYYILLSQLTFNLSLNATEIKLNTTFNISKSNKIKSLIFSHFSIEYTDF